MSREDLGRAAHQAMVHYFDGKSLILTKDDYTWEGLDEETRELYRCEADGVIETFKQERMSETKHDGNLGDRYSVAFNYSTIEMRDQGAEFVGLSAKQALSLLAWLQQEREKLELLAKENNNNGN